MLKEDDLNYLYQYACSLTQNDEQAYDFVHEAVIQVQRYNPSNYRAYAKTTIRNLFFKEYKKQSKFEEVEDLDSLGADTRFEDIAIAKDSVKLVLSRVKPEERELLYEWAVEGKTFAEIAQEQGRKLGSLLSKVSRLKKKILKMEIDL